MSATFDYYQDQIQINKMIYKSFFANAFSSKFYNIWHKTDFANEINDLAFLYSIVIFLSNNFATENDRRRLLYYYCAPSMSTNSEKSLLNKLIPILPTSNTQFIRVLRKICNLYDAMPNRTIIGKNDIELLNIINLSDYNITMDKCYKIAKSCNEVICRPLFVNGKLLFEIITPDNYRYNVDNFGNIIELYVYRHREVQRTFNKDVIDTFDIWTNETYSILDSNLKSIKGYEKSIPNPYKEIPYVFLNLEGKNVYDENSDAILWELVKAQLDKNRSKILEDNSAINNGFPIQAFINFELDEDVSLGPGMFIQKDGVNSDINTPPYFEQLNPAAQYAELHTLGDDNMKAVLRDFELPSSMLGENGEIPSGVALEIGMMGLNELRKVDKPKMKQFENDMINLIAKMAVYEGKMTKFSAEKNYEITIEYNELKKPTDPKLEFELNKVKFEMGLIDAKTFIMSVTDIDNFETNEQVIKYINENVKLIKGIENGTGSETTGSETTGTDNSNTGSETTGI
ncbi:MAG: hypothetical protein ABFC34_13945 [Methanobacterium sp.]